MAKRQTVMKTRLMISMPVDPGSVEAITENAKALESLKASLGEAGFSVHSFETSLGTISEDDA